MKSEWISVKDRVPMHGQRVLVVCINQQNRMQRHVSICDHHFSINPRGERFSRWSGWKSVTHWMPLPELPEVNDGR